LNNEKVEQKSCCAMMRSSFFDTYQRATPFYIFDKKMLTSCNRCVIFLLSNK